MCLYQKYSRLLKKIKPTTFFSEAHEERDCFMFYSIFRKITHHLYLIIHNKVVLLPRSFTKAGSSPPWGMASGSGVSYIWKGVYCALFLLSWNFANFQIIAEHCNRRCPSGVYTFVYSPQCILFNRENIVVFVYLIIYTLRGASSLLVLDYRVMRRPQDVERVTGTLSTHFLYI